MNNKPSVGNWPYVPAKFFTRVDGKRKIRLIVMHSMEAPETEATAENVARYFQKIPRPASAHICVDSNSIVRCVQDNDVAYGAPGVNKDGIHIELAGYAKQTGGQWLDPYGVLMLDAAAIAAAQFALAYQLPLVHLSAHDLKAGKSGVIGHWDATQVYLPNAGHTDPGREFPWDFFIKRAGEHLSRLAPTKKG